MCRACRASLALLLLIGGSTSVRAADPPRLRELRTQRVGETTYFHVGFEQPANLAVPQLLPRFGGTEFWPSNALGRLPYFVPQDAKAHAVYARVERGNEDLPALDRKSV